MQCIVLTISLAISTLAFAASDDNEFQCNRSGNQQEMNACAVKDYKTADKALNAEYKARISSLPTQSQDSLRKEQRIWLKQRDQKCRDEVKDSEGGSIWPLEFYGCLEAATAKRTKEIKAWHPKQ